MKQYKGFRQVINGQLQPRFPHDQRRYEVYTSDLTDGCYEESFKRAKKEKTDPQRGYIFGGMIKKTVEYCNDNDHIIDTSNFLDLMFDNKEVSGVEVTPDFVKACLYRANPTLDENDKEITLRDMSSEQASAFMDKSADLLSTRICPITGPDKNYKKG